MYARRRPRTPGPGAQKNIHDPLCIARLSYHGTTYHTFQMYRQTQSSSASYRVRAPRALAALHSRHYMYFMINEVLHCLAATSSSTEYATHFGKNSLCWLVAPTGAYAPPNSAAACYVRKNGDSGTTQRAFQSGFRSYQGH